ncbi:STAS domain-containing protein [Amycolatopsis sp. CA-128772]|uniref:STAS domain-containing protein n=1 Tax=Amycolatopsis sp. CA-128772 TaxID=2073159 RepID=UPI000CCFE94D|nr:STAS domain-containing protein [Amycolatopsis sp. CA-128772]
MSSEFVPRPRRRWKYSPEASFTVTRTAETSVVTAVGDLDLTVTGDLAALLGQEIDLRPQALVLDASAVTFCAARGVTVLLDALADAEVAGVPFAVVGRQQALLRPITAPGLEQVLPLHQSTADAVAWLALLPQLTDLNAG